MSMRGWWLLFCGGLSVLAFIAWTIARTDRSATSESTDSSVATATAAAGETAHIAATVFFGSPDGQALIPVRRDVPLAGNIVEQGRQILTAQLSEAAPPPYLGLIPAGTTLRAFYLTERGDAFVDLSPEVVSSHPGGSLGELLTVYALVHAVTANLPAAKRVQILVDGKEVDTIAGHVDLRRPLTPDASLVRQSGSK